MTDLYEAWNAGYASAAQHSADGTLGHVDPGNPYRGDPEPSESVHWEDCGNTVVGVRCTMREGHSGNHVYASYKMLCGSPRPSYTPATCTYSQGHLGDHGTDDGEFWENQDAD